MTVESLETRALLTFAPAVNLTTGASPLAVAFGDFNGDSKSDIVVANSNPNTISLLLGDGVGGFGPKSDFSVGSNPNSLAVGDFNGDGKQDVAVGNLNSSNVSILLGNGAGGFTAAPNIATGRVTTLVAGDFNLDGKMDLVAGIQNSFFASPVINVLLGSGNGGFAVSSLAVRSEASRLAVGDFNADGKPDLFSSNQLDGSVSVLLGNGIGSFPTVAFAAVRDPLNAAVGDFNGDNNLDVAVVSVSTQTLSVLLGNGTGGLALATSIPIGSTLAVARGDFNGDGKQDLAATNLNAVSILHGDGVGGFANAGTFAVGTTPFSMAVGDFNGDGKPDVATSNVSSANVSVLLNVGERPVITASAFTIAEGGTLVLGSSNINASDADNTPAQLTYTASGVTGGQFELVAAPGVAITSFTQAQINASAVRFVQNGNNTSRVSSFSLSDPLGNTRFAPLTITVTNVAPSNLSLTLSPPGVLARGTTTLSGSFVDPGREDTHSVVIAWGDGTPDTTLNLGAGVVSIPATNHQYLATGTYTISVTVTDLDGASTSTTTSVSVVNSVKFAPAVNVSMGSAPASVTVGDFNGDGKSDLAVANSLGGTVSVRLGNGSGSFGPATDFGVGSFPRFVTVGDFNGDGKTDLVTANNSGNDVSVLLGDGAGGFSAATNFAVGSQPFSLAVGDFNGDGKSDIAAASFSSSNVSILLGNGAGRFSLFTTISTGRGTASVTVGDFNGDGKADLAAVNFLDNNVSVLLGDGAGDFARFTTLPISGTGISITSGDFNGDGKLDLATANQSTFNVSVFLGNGIGGFDAAGDLVAGGNPRSIVASDLNGDGKLDLAVANASTSNVSVLLGIGAGRFLAAANFGVGNLPTSVAAADFNGDGKLDLATANNSGNTASVLISAPVISSSAFSLAEGGTLILNSSHINATSPGSTPAQLTYTVSGITGGRFELVASPGVAINSFTQAQINAGAVQFVQDGADTVSVNLFRVTDVDGDSNQASLAITVTNVAPTLSNLSTTRIFENQVAALTGFIVDPGRLDAFTLQVNWGDPLSPNNVETYNFPAGTTSFSLTHTYLDDNPTNSVSDQYSISLQVTDDEGGSSNAVTSVTVDNKPARLVVLADNGVIAENSFATITGLVFDPGTLDSFTVQFDWGDPLSPNNIETYSFPAGTTRFSVSHQYLDNNDRPVAFAVLARIFDDDNLGDLSSSDLSATPVLVTNAAPSNASITVSASPLDENGTTSISGSFVDPGTLDSHSVLIDWGDGASETLSLAAGVLSFSSTVHRYVDNGTYTVTVTVTDKDGASTLTTASVVVNNVAPSSASINVSASPIDENGSTSISGSFVDPGTLDTRAVLINWGDGLSETLNLNAGVLTIPSTSHQYKDNGNYTITVTVTDKDGASTLTTASVVVNNVAPSNASITVSASPIDENGSTSISGSFVDPGTLDTHAVLINWGDGLSETLNLNAGVLTIPSTSHQYKDNGNYTITVTVTDKDGASTLTTASVVVNNVAPSSASITVSASPIDENGSTSISGSFVDPGTLDTHAVLINWGDGSSETISLTAGVLTIPSTFHQYKDNGNYTITVTVTDKDGASTLTTASVVVNNVAPSSASITVSASPIDENGSTSISGSFVDPGTLDTHAVLINWGDGSSETISLTAGVLTIPSTFHQYKDNGNYTITVTVTDKDGASTLTTASVVVNNVAPSSASITVSATPIDENGSTSISGSFVDPGTLDTHAVLINWGDGLSETLNLNAGVLTIPSTSHQYKDNGNYTITVTVTDKDGASTLTTASVLVNNVAPSSASITVSATPIDENGSTSISGSFVDPGTLDTHAVLINWGDGLSETLNLNAGVLTIPSTSHQYKDNGNYTITVTVTDKDGASTLTTASLVVNNVAPSNASITVSASPIDENGSTSISGSFVDPGTLDTHAVLINWGDGLSETLNLNAGVLTIPSTSHQYKDNGNYTITVTVTDKDGASTLTTASVVVNNVAPVLSNLVATVISENGVTTLTGTITDPGTLDTFTLDVNWGDPLSPNNVERYTLAAGATTFQLTHRYLDDNPTGSASDVYSINLTVTDKDSGSANAQTTVTVNNVAPVITSLTNVTPGSFIGINQPVTLSGLFTDVGTLDTFRVTTDWGDGSVTNGTISTAGSNRSFTNSLAYRNAGVYTVTTRLFDDDGGVDVRTTTVAVAGASVVNGTLVIVGTPGDDTISLGVVGTFAFVVAPFLPNGVQILTGFQHVSVFSLDGNDKITASSFLLPGSLVLDAGNGNDEVISAGPSTIFGGAGNDKLTVGAASQVFGGDGDDVLTGSEFSDSLEGGAGNDQIFGMGGDDRLIGGADNDTLNGGTGNDFLDGGDGDDKVYGGAGIDRVQAGLGNDIANVDYSVDSFVISAPFDLASTSLSSTSLTATIDWGDGTSTPAQVSLQGGVATVSGSRVYPVGGFYTATVTLRDAQNRSLTQSYSAAVVGAGVVGNNLQVVGTYLGEAITVVTVGTNSWFVQVGSNPSQTITNSAIRGLFVSALDGDDTVTVLAPSTAATLAVVVDAGAGNDRVFTINGVQAVLGGAGDDYLAASGGFAGIDGGAGNDTIELNTTLPGSIANGGDGNDVIRGSSLADTIDGGAGDDQISGFGGDDLLRGGDGNDRLDGGIGNDILLGGAGNDILLGSTGRDILIGGQGIDAIAAIGNGALMIGGSTVHDGNDAALRAIMDEWSSTGSFATRVSNIRGTGASTRKNGNFFISQSTLIDDLAVDVMTGSGDADWFWSLSANDIVTNAGANDRVN